MKSALGSAAAFITTLGLFYLFGAFVEWKINAGAWEAGTRASLLILAVPVAVSAAIGATAFTE